MLKVLKTITVLQFVYCHLSNAQHVQSLDQFGPLPSAVGTRGSSLDHMPADNHPPPWIDPFSSGTYSQSNTPFFNWGSLMGSSSMSGMHHGIERTHSIQIGEGIPVESVQVVEEVPSSVMNIDKATQDKVDNLHVAADSKQPSIKPLPSDTGVLPNNDVMIVPPTDLHNPMPRIQQPGGQDIPKMESDFGVLPSDNLAGIDPNVLSPENPVHADMIDLMMRRDMAKEPDQTAVFQPSFKPDPFGVNQPSVDFTNEVVPVDIIPPEGSVVLDTPINIPAVGSPKIISETNKKGNNKQQRKNQRRLENQQQRQAEKQIRQQVRKEQRTERKNQRKAVRQQERQIRKQKVFSEKLVAQKRRRMQRIQDKISKQVKKLEMLNQEANDISPVTTQTNEQLPSPTNTNQAFNVQETIKEQNVIQNQNNPGGKNKKPKKKGKGGKKERKNKRKNKGRRQGIINNKRKQKNRNAKKAK